MKKLSVLIIGSGGREHALAWKLAQSERVSEIFVAPGNAGTAVSHTNVPIADNDIPGLIRFAQERGIGLTAVGPEVPLAAGIVDAFQAVGLTIFGPTQAAAQLESSKAFAKAFMQKHGIPTATSVLVTDYDTAVNHLVKTQDFASLPGKSGVVIKASGLAAGKGVIVCDNVEQAKTALHKIMVERAFGNAGDEVLIEERMFGPELSLLLFTDGKTAVPMAPARDHKRAYNNDQGPNTGGMGAYAPPPDVDQQLIDHIMQTIVQPTIDNMAAQGTPYIGVLYAGLMLTQDGPKVIEFNCRFGDPETQVLLPLLKGDLAEIMLACIAGNLQPEMVQQHDGACATIVLASPGYPASYPKGLPITGLEDVPETAVTFHAGTKMANDTIVTSGGRVLAVSARGADLETAVTNAYTGVAQIRFDGVHFRTDIGKKVSSSQ
ncbi:MAG: phosphoribosylamine--glycine ligase [Chloroflexi bacterium]|nr:phosphoribosylamine--glycine ligase [Chloroflexota bacterium]